MHRLPVYQCHKKVAAAKIISIITTAEPAGASLILDGLGIDGIQVDAAWLARNPKVAEGGYFVCYIENEDQYTAYSPAKPFEDGYTRAPGNGANSGAKPYIATKTGYLHSHGIIEAGTKFTYDGERLGWMKPDGWSDEAGAEPQVEVELSREEIVSRLQIAGIQFFKGATTEKLKATLDSLKG